MGCRRALSREETAQCGQTARQEMVREIAVAARGVTARLHSLAWSIESEAKHSIFFAADGANAPQESAHFSLRE